MLLFDILFYDRLKMEVISMDFQKTASNWIWNGEKGINQYACFRKEFDLSEDSAVLYISCDTNYSLWVNGQWVNFGQYLAYPKDKHYDEIDISKYIVNGKNSIGILVYYQGVNTFSYSVGEAGLFYAIKTKDGFISNEDTYTKKASGFKEGEIDLITWQLGPSFSFDARKNEEWTEKDYVMDETWVKATTCDKSDVFPFEMKKRPIKKLQLEKANAKVIMGGELCYRSEDVSVSRKMQNAFLRTDSSFYKEENGEIVIAKDNSYVILDLGKEMSGYFNLEMTSPEGVKIDIAYGEHLLDMRVRAFDHDNNNFAFDYTAKEGKQSFFNFFRRLGGRYLQLNFTNVKSPVTIHNAGIFYASYPVRETSRLKLSDSLDKKIYEISIRTLRECMHDTFEDCPWREQGLYGFDSRNQGLCGYSVFENGNYEFVKASLSLLGDSLGDDGILAICALTDTEKYKIPSFTLYWVIFVSEYVSYSGDKEFAKEILPKIKKVINEYFKDYDTAPIKRINGENYWNFYDWKGILAGENSEENFVAETDVLCNLIAAFMAKKAVSLAMAAGDKEYAKELKEIFKRLKKTVNTYFYDEKTGLYKTLLDGQHTCQYAQAMALLTDIAINPKACEKALLNPPEDMAMLNLSTSQFKYEALLKNRKNYAYVLDEVRRIWGNMLYDGATTFYETEGGALDPMAGSLCHGWSAVPIYVYEKIFGNFYDKEN